MAKKYHRRKTENSSKNLDMQGGNKKNEQIITIKVATPENKTKNSLLAETAKYFFISLAIFIAILIFSSLFLTPKISNKFEIKEAQLVKIKEINLVPGEVYVYDYISNNSVNKLTHIIRQGPGCIFIEIKEAVNKTGICVDKYGTDKTKSNATFDIPYVSLFKPWMLAVNDEWKWNVKAVVNSGTFEVNMLDLNYAVVKKERIFGRDAYVVNIESVTDPKQSSTLWVDDEKRILLKEIGLGYEIILESAPFVLTFENNSNNMSK